MSYVWNKVSHGEVSVLGELFSCFFFWKRREGSLWDVTINVAKTFYTTMSFCLDGIDCTGKDNADITVDPCEWISKYH